jgi:nitroreductase
MLKVIEKRKSVREYKDKKIDTDVIKELNDILEKRPEIGTTVEFSFIENGDKVFDALDGFAGYNGVMIKAPHYMAILSENKPNYLMESGYLAEWYSLHMAHKNIGTCWIELSNKSEQAKKMLGIESDKELIGILAIGYSKAEHHVSRIYDTTKGGSISPLTDLGYPNIDPVYSKGAVSGRKPIDEIVFMNNWGEKASIEKLEQFGLAEVFYYMRMAPSWGNRQPWKFLISGGKITLAIELDNPFTDSEDDRYISEIEAGIAMLYFEVAMHDEGMPGHWNFDCDANSLNIPEEYFVAGAYTYN